jgi:hypothetical protein
MLLAPSSQGVPHEINVTIDRLEYPLPSLLPDRGRGRRRALASIRTSCDGAAGGADPIAVERRHTALLGVL